MIAGTLHACFIRGEVARRIQMASDYVRGKAAFKELVDVQPAPYLRALAAPLSAAAQ